MKFPGLVKSLWSCLPSRTRDNNNMGGGGKLRHRSEAARTVPCPHCARLFTDHHAVAQHAAGCRERQGTARQLPCPTCGKLYRYVSDAAQHFESGSCPGCPGREAARQVAYGFVANSAAGQRFLTAPLALTDGGYGAPLRLTCGAARSHVSAPSGTTGYLPPPDPNYNCPTCGKQFRALSDLMQHQSAKAACGGGGASGTLLSLPPRRAAGFGYVTELGTDDDASDYGDGSDDSDSDYYY